MLRPLVLAVLLATGCASVFASCPTGQSEMSVEGVNGVFCVASSPICIATISNGACPTAQEGLPYGSYCGVVATGVYGCKTLNATSTSAPSSVSVNPSSALTPAPATTSPPPTPSATDGSQCAWNQYEMSVEGVAGVFCLNDGPICMADRSTGTCPGPQHGLPNGSYCGVVASGVYGCKVNTGAPAVATSAPSLSPPAPSSAPASSSAAPSTRVVPVATTSSPVPGPTNGTQCANGDYEMSVEGVPGIFCLNKGPICMAELSTGTCPGPQYGLPNGSYCGVVASGVYGCKPNMAAATSSPAVTASPPASVSTAPTTNAPAPIGPSAVPTPTCANGGTPMSVEGIVPIFCVQEPACVAQRATGNCPSSQDGLPFGSYCDVITRTGQYGCKPFNGTNVRSNVVYPAVRSCLGNTHGNTPVSVVGAATYCAYQPVCAGEVFGNCPVAQDALPRDSKCVRVSSGVYGCVQST